MSHANRFVAVPPEDVFAVLADPYAFPAFVVGASRARDVDGRWPEPGAVLHHSVGLWPALLNDTTSVVEAVPPHRLVLQARAWPFGEARVTITLQPEGTGTRASIEEEPTHGPALVAKTPPAQWFLSTRNSELLRRLAEIAEGRARLVGAPTAGELFATTTGSLSSSRTGAASRTGLRSGGGSGVEGGSGDATAAGTHHDGPPVAPYEVSPSATGVVIDDAGEPEVADHPNVE